MLALSAEEAHLIIEAKLADDCAGMPPPYFLNLCTEAQSWAAFAALQELTAYLAAIWQRLPESEREKFLQFIGASFRRDAA